MLITYRNIQYTTYKVAFQQNFTRPQICHVYLVINGRKLYFICQHIFFKIMETKE